MYTQRQIARGNKYLLRLADFVERRQRAAPKRGYMQELLKYGDGAPGCLLGHARTMTARGHLPRGLAALRFALTGAEHSELFSWRGCSDAGSDWQQAVKYVCDFVARRRARADCR